MTKKKKKKKGNQKFLGDNEIFLGKKWRNFVGRRVKKGRSKIPAKIWPPVCEVLDPLLDPLVVRGLLPSAIAVLRLRRLIPISPPKQKIPAPLAPPNKKSLYPHCLANVSSINCRTLLRTLKSV